MFFLIWINSINFISGGWFQLRPIELVSCPTHNSIDLRHSYGGYQVERRRQECIRIGEG